MVFTLSEPSCHEDDPMILGIQAYVRHGAWHEDTQSVLLWSSHEMLVPGTCHGNTETVLSCNGMSCCGTCDEDTKKVRWI